LCMHMCCMYIYVYRNAGMPDCPAFGQSGTGMNRTNDAGTGSVPDYADPVRHFFSPVPD
jgi:hypothetical protein